MSARTISNPSAALARAGPAAAAARGGPTTACPRCGGALACEDRLLIGEVLRCDGCNAELEVTSIDPPLVAPWARVDDELDE